MLAVYTRCVKAVSAKPAFKNGFRPPLRSQTIGMRLFIASLTMLFVASMIGYVLVRVGSPKSPPLHSVSMPGLLLLSTVLILAGSVAIHRAVAADRRERQGALRGWLAATMVLAVAFVAVQAPALAALLGRHVPGEGTFLYGLIFFLVLVHALHVVGGIVALVPVSVKGFLGRYDHESHGGVRFAAWYWHFLDVVWLVMFGTMLILG